MDIMSNNMLNENNNIMEYKNELKSILKIISDLDIEMLILYGKASRATRSKENIENLDAVWDLAEMISNCEDKLSEIETTIRNFSEKEY